MQAQETQSRIMAAAVIAFGQYGYKKTTMQDIADEAGLSRPAVYQYYKNKGAVFNALLIEVFTQAKAAALTFFEGSETPYYRLTEGLLAFEKVVLTPTLTTAKGHELIALAESMEPEEMDSIRQWLHGHLVTLIREGITTNELSFHGAKHNEEQVAQLILAGITGVKHSVKSMDELDEQSRLLFDLLYNGLKAQ